MVKVQLESSMMLISQQLAYRIILSFPEGHREEKPWAWFEQKSREERERVKAWRR